MLKLRSVTAGLLATAMLATSVTPAVAQSYPGGYSAHGYGRPGYDQNYNRYRQHRRHNDNSGAVVAGVIGVGILAAIIASAASKKNQQQRHYGYGQNGYPQNGYQNGYGQNGYPQNGYATGAYGSIRTDDAAADACATAAERQFGGNARVRSIDGVDRVSDGFNVRGTVASGYGARDGYRDGGRDGDSRSFSCSVRYGDVQRIDFGGYGYRN